MNMSKGERIDLPGGDAVLFKDYHLGYGLPHLMEFLTRNIPWEQQTLAMYGKEVLEPRLIAWYGDHPYTYSGRTQAARPLIPTLNEIRIRMEELIDGPLNGVLLNLYRDGKDSIGMHADNEPEFGKHPTIVSVSLGSTRTFKFQSKFDKSQKVTVPLESGSVLIMRGATQENWKHGIDKTKEELGPRINLTFRNIINPRR
jgi:alkylated DNA repair dioxygenase AlkB